MEVVEPDIDTKELMLECTQVRALFWYEVGSPRVKSASSRLALERTDRPQRPCGSLSARFDTQGPALIGGGGGQAFFLVPLARG